MNGEPARRIAVVIPSYKVKQHVLDVIEQIGDEVGRIYVVDDCCPEGSGDFVEASCRDSRVVVIRNPENLGVGGAVMNGYRAAIAEDMEIIVKLDGDGQMDPSLIMDFVMPIVTAEAAYTKGNRFFDLEDIRAMPRIRIFGNAVLSFMTKLSSGYWNLFDPTNGYTAIHRDVARHLPFKKISRRYFFETDLLFHLNSLSAVVMDVPMSAKYGNEVSNLKISKVLFEFLAKHLRNFFKRIFYNYYLRDMSLASLELPLGILLLLLGGAYGGYHWLRSLHAGITTPAGTVMAAALPLIIGVQFILGFIGHDIATVPKRPLHKSARWLASRRKGAP